MKIYSDHEANKEDWNWTNKCSLWRSLDQFFLHTHPQHHHCWPPFPTLTNGVSQGIFSENMWLPKTESTWSYFLKHSKISLLNSNIGMGLTMVVGQNANRTKCQPDIMPTKGWNYVRTFFCGWHFVRPKFLVGILSRPSQHVLAFCRNHENHISLNSQINL